MPHCEQQHGDGGAPTPLPASTPQQRRHAQPESQAAVPLPSLPPRSPSVAAPILRGSPSGTVALSLSLSLSLFFCCCVAFSLLVNVSRSVAVKGPPVS